MKYGFYIDQRTLHEKFPTLTIRDAALLAFLGDAFNSPNFKTATVEGYQYTWISHKTIAEEMPLLGLQTADGVQKRIKRLRDAGLIASAMIDPYRIGHRPGPAWDVLTGLATPTAEIDGPPPYRHFCPPPTATDGGPLPPPAAAVQYSNINDQYINAEPPVPPKGGAAAEISNSGSTPKPPKPKPAKIVFSFPARWEQDAPFQAALADYLTVRKEKRQPMTPRAAELLTKKLLSASIENATVALQTSAANGWTGVFPKDGTGRDGASRDGTTKPTNGHPMNGKTWEEKKLRSYSDPN